MLELSRAMVIYFSCPITDLLAHKNDYIEERNSILKSGNTINRDWIDTSIERAINKVPDPPTPQAYKETMEAIVTADALICDVTVKSMALGHIVTFALQKMKPVLLLYFGEIRPNHLFIAMSKSPLLSIKSYNKTEDIFPIIKAFCQNSEYKSKTRFNLSINKAQNSYLDWKSFVAKRSKTEIIQDAINEKIKDDDDFKKYIDS